MAYQSFFSNALNKLKGTNKITDPMVTPKNTAPTAPYKTNTPTATAPKPTATPKIDLTAKPKTGTGVYQSQYIAGITPEDEALMKQHGAEWGAAKTSKEKNIAHAANEAIRDKYHFSGGTDGSQYNSIPNSVTNTLSQNGYDSELSPKAMSLLEGITNGAKFSYDPATDDAFQKYKTEMIEAGNKAYGSSVAGASIPGIATNSVAEQIAQGANTEALKNIGNAEQTFFDKAYGKYLDNQRSEYDKLNAVLGIDNTGYGRYSEGKNFDYKAGRDKVSDNQWDKTFNFNKDTDMRNFTYQQTQDKINNAINQGQLSVSQGNLALSKARQDADQFPDSLDNQLKRDTLEANKASKEATAFNNTISKIDGLYTSKDPVSGVVSVNETTKPQLRSYIVGLRLPDPQTDELLLRYGLPINK